MRIAACSILTLWLALTCLAYQGPLVTPPPTVNGSSGPVAVTPGQSVVVTWDIRQFAKRNYPPQSGPSHVFYEVKRGSDFVGDEDRSNRVEARGDLPLRGKMSLNTRGWPGGDYYVRIVAKRGGNTPQHDVAHRSRSVRIQLGSQAVSQRATLRIQPVLAQIQVPEGRTRFQAFLSEGAGRVEWSVEGGTAFGKIIPDFDDSTRATLVAPEQLPPGTSRIRVLARLRDDPSVSASAEATVQYSLPPIVGPTPRPTGPAATASPPPPSARLPGADDQVEVTAFTCNPEQPVQGFGYTLYLSIRNRSGRNLTGLKWHVLAEGGSPVDQGAVTVANGATVRIPIRIEGNLATAYGTRYYLGQVDPSNGLGESLSDRDDNQRDLWVEVQRAEQVVQDLDFAQAVQAGAGFRMNFFSEDGRSVSEQPWHKDIHGSVSGSYPTPSTWYQVEVPETSAILELNARAPLGTVEARPEAFTDFALKNGWVVDSVETRNGGPDEVGGSVRWLVTPEPGSARPYVRAKLEVPHSPGQITAFVRIKIRGPRGLSPYK